MNNVTPYMESLMRGIIDAYPLEGEDRNFHIIDINSSEDTIVPKNERARLMKLGLDDLIDIAYSDIDLSEASRLIFEISRFVISIRPTNQELFEDSHEMLKNTLIHAQRNINSYALYLIARILFRQTIILYREKLYNQFIDDIEFYKTELFRIYRYHYTHTSTNFYKNVIEKAFLDEIQYDYVKEHINYAQYRSFGYLGEHDTYSVSYLTIPYYFQRLLVNIDDRADWFNYEEIILNYKEEMDLFDKIFGLSASFDREDLRKNPNSNNDYCNIKELILNKRVIDNYPALAFCLFEIADDLTNMMGALANIPPIYQMQNEPSDVIISESIENEIKSLKRDKVNSNIEKGVKSIPIVILGVIAAICLVVDIMFGTVYVLIVPALIACWWFGPKEKVKRTVIHHYDIYGFSTGDSVIEEPINDKGNK